MDLKEEKEGREDEIHKLKNDIAHLNKKLEEERNWNKRRLAEAYLVGIGLLNQLQSLEKTRVEEKISLAKSAQSLGAYQELVTQIQMMEAYHGESTPHGICE